MKQRNRALRMGFFAVLLFVLAFSISVPTSYAANTTVKSITISKKKLKLKKGKTYKLKAKLSPKKAKGKISWKSNNKKVATVSKKGLVKAKKVGSATITAYVKGTKIKKTCKVTVTAASKPNTASAQTPTPTTEPAQTPATELPQTPATELPQTPTTEPTTELTPATEPVTEPETEVTEGVATATTQEELEQLLATEPKEIRIRTEEEGASFSVPAGNHQGTILSVDVPNGKVENTGYFQQIVIQSIGDHTYVEKAVGNHILYEAESGRIQIAEGAKADIEIASIKTEPSLDLENDGEITELLISNQALVVITGISTSRAIPVTAGQESYGSIINTSQNVKLMADAAIELILQEGAEESTAFIYDSSDTPTVVGLGCVTVTDYSKGEVRTVVAENNASEERTVTVTGKVADGATEQGLSGAVLSVFAYSRELEEEYLEQNTEEAEYTAVANEDGIYEIPNVPVGNYFMVIQQSGYISVTQTLMITSMEDEAYSNGVILLSKISEEACGSISGRLYDAENGKPIDYAVVLNVRRGWNNLSGSPISTFYIDSSDEGMYSFDDLPAGAYTIQVFSAPLSDAQIVADSFSVAVLGGMDHTRNFDVTQAIAEDQIRFVLQWGDEASNAPRDLDAHLVGPTLYGEQFHVWFSDRNYSENGSDIAAELDVDCDSWEGPETITIYQEVEGIYQYYVFDYENRFDEMSPYLSDTSEAVVRVYQGNMLRATFYVPEGETGNLWHVCAYDSVTGQITAVNEVEYWPSEGMDNIGASQLEMTKEVLGSRIDTLAQYLEYVQEGTYRTELQEDLSKAAELYDLSSDQEELQSISVALQTYIDDIESFQYIYDISGDHITNWYTEQNEIYITGDAPEDPGEFEVIPENEDAKITYSPEQSGDYWGRIIVEDEEKGIRKVWKVYYTYYDSSIFNISGIEGDGILTFEAESFDGEDRGALYIYGDANEMPDFTLYPENEDVTWEYTPTNVMGIEGYVTMYYEDTEYIYYVYYETTEE